MCTLPILHMKRFIPLCYSTPCHVNTAQQPHLCILQSKYQSVYAKDGKSVDPPRRHVANNLFSTYHYYVADQLNELTANRDPASLYLN